MNELFVYEIQVAEDHGIGLDPRKTDRKPVLRL